MSDICYNTVSADGTDNTVLGGGAMQNIFSGKSDVYVEVAERYERFIMLGILKDGDKLPSVRTAAGELGVNPNTVQKAYSLLEEKGLIRALPKKGAFVTYSSAEGKEERKEKERKDIFDTLSRLKNNGAAKEDILLILEEVFKE